MDPGLWLLRAADTADRPRAEEMRRLAAYLEEMPTHPRLIRMFRKLLADYGVLRDGLATVANGRGANGRGAGDTRTRTALSLLHAIRLTLMQEMFLLATRIPPFSSQHSISQKRVISWILHLDVPNAVDHLEHIFPATNPLPFTGGFGESATYVSDESQNYRQENERIFKPLTGLYELLRRTSVGITHRIGFFG
jgi:phosphoenolpyruvate carboxylase